MYYTYRVLIDWENIKNIKNIRIIREREREREKIWAIKKHFLELKTSMGETIR